MSIKKDNDRAEKEALDLLPYRLASSAVKSAALWHGVINEIRLRENRPLCITSGGKNIKCGAICTREDIDTVVRRLCSNSLYSHAETIREGYITSQSGIRAGICGRAVVGGGVITTVTDISSVCIRIPRRVSGAGDLAYSLLEKTGFTKGLLVYSVPGVGKTTLLRELIAKLASGDDAKRVAVVDTRSELAAGIDDDIMADVLSAYPRAKGIEISVRTLSPEYIICDEIGSAADAAAILEAAGSGVKMIASAHAGSMDELMKCGFLKELSRKDVFGICLGLLDRDTVSGEYISEVSYFEDTSEYINKQRVI